MILPSLNKLNSYGLDQTLEFKKTHPIGDGSLVKEKMITLSTMVVRVVIDSLKPLEISTWVSKIVQKPRETEKEKWGKCLSENEKWNEIKHSYHAIRATMPFWHSRMSFSYSMQHFHVTMPQWHCRESFSPRNNSLLSERPISRFLRFGRNFLVRAPFSFMK